MIWIQIDNCFEKIYLLIESFQERLYKLQDSYFAKAYFVKIKFNDFSQTTLERSNINTLDVDIIKEMYESGELKKVFDNKGINYKK